MASIQITNEQVRRYMLLKAGLIGEKQRDGKAGVMDFIRSVACLQFDPIDSCGRSADITLQSRVKNYKKSDLQELLYTEHVLHDYWDKCMCIFPVEDWPYFARRRQHHKENPYFKSEAMTQWLSIAYSKVSSDGPITSAALGDGPKIRWPWGQAPIGRAALEMLYDQGEIIISNKKINRKHYDLTVRHIPAAILEAQDANATLGACNEQ